MEIRIERQRVCCHIGVPDEERSQPQTLEITTSFPVPSPKDDEISHTVNYYEVYCKVEEIAQAHPRKLVETLINDLILALQEAFSLREIDIEIRKFILPNAEAVIIHHHWEAS